MQQNNITPEVKEWLDKNNEIAYHDGIPYEVLMVGRNRIENGLIPLIQQQERSRIEHELYVAVMECKGVIPFDCIKTIINSPKEGE